MNKTRKPVIETPIRSTSRAPTLLSPIPSGRAHTGTRVCPRRTAFGTLGATIGGFTVLELMVTIALGGILAAIAAPGMMELIRGNRLSTAARQLNADILLARREAIKRNTRVLVCPVGSTVDKCGSGTAWTQGWLVCYDANLDGDCDNAVAGDPNPIRKHGALDATLTLTGTASVARFNANGTQGPAGAASLTLTTKGTWTGAKSYVETVTATGNISMAGS